VALVSYAAFLYTSELGCYMQLFHYLYVHNNGIGILSVEVKKRRNKTNAQTMMGQFYFFIVDTLHATFIFLAFLPGISPVSSELKDLGIFIKYLDFGLVSLIQCLLIPDLRREFLAYHLNLFSKIKGRHSKWYNLLFNKK
jgi:hypothetical protein